MENALTGGRRRHKQLFESVLRPRSKRTIESPLHIGSRRAHPIRPIRLVQFHDVVLWKMDIRAFGDRGGRAEATSGRAAGVAPTVPHGPCVELGGVLVHVGYENANEHEFVPRSGGSASPITTGRAMRGSGRAP